MILIFIFFRSVLGTPPPLSSGEKICDGSHFYFFWAPLSVHLFLLLYLVSIIPLLLILRLVLMCSVCHGCVCGVCRVSGAFKPFFFCRQSSVLCGRGLLRRGRHSKDMLLTLLEPQSRSGGNSLIIWAGCPQNGTAVLKTRLRLHCCCKNSISFVPTWNDCKHITVDSLIRLHCSNVERP